MLELELLFDVAGNAALLDWVEGRRSDTAHLDRRHHVPLGDVLTDQSEDERFLMLQQMRPERRHQVIDQLRDVMSGYPWLIHREPIE